MPSTSDLYGQLTGAMGKLQQFQPGNQADFNNALSSRVGNFAPQYQDLGKMDAGIYAAPANQMTDFYKQYGTGGNVGLDPMQGLQQMMQRTGQMQGNRDAYANTISQAGGRINDLANAALGGYNAQRQGLQDNLGYLQNMYGLSNTNDQNALQRQNNIQVAQANNAAAMMQANAMMNEAKATQGLIHQNGIKNESFLPSIIDPSRTDDINTLINAYGATPVQGSNGQITGYQLPHSQRIIQLGGSGGLFSGTQGGLNLQSLYNNPNIKFGH